MQPFRWENLRRELLPIFGASRSADVANLCEPRQSTLAHGTLPKWQAAWDQLPTNGVVDLEKTRSRDAVNVAGDVVNCAALRRILMEFHPWRKGPFELFGLRIDTEWRSNLKWDRLASRVDFRGKKILDVGCGNGYYGWKMLAAGAEFVLGCEPFLLYVMQFEVFRRYATLPQKHFVLPITDEEIPDDLRCFDATLSMGVLYHRTSPIDHLRKLASTLQPNGQLILETLVLDSNREEVFVPKGRYAKMRNVWFIPSLSMLEVWLQRTGFHTVEVLDVTRTTSQEQRRTEWMTFESLSDFLHPSDPTRTIEGYPGPVRAMVSARLRP